MRLDKITRQVFIEVGGEEYGLKLTLSGLQQLEKTTGNIITMLNTQPLPSLTTLTTAFWIGLGGSLRMRRDEAEAILSDYMADYGMGGNTGDNEGAVTVFYAMIAASGILGKKASNDILRQFGPRSFHRVFGKFSE